MGIDKYYSVWALICGSCGAHLNAYWPLTIVTKCGKKIITYIRVITLFYYLYPGLPYTWGNTIFYLASHRTTVAANTTTKIYNHSVSYFCHPGVPLLKVIKMSKIIKKYMKSQINIFKSETIK
jgi:hypothetical protein